MKYYIGHHESLSKNKIGIVKVIENYIEQNLFTFQCFVGSPMAVALSKFTEDEITKVNKLVKDNKFLIQAHGKYLYNLCKEFDENGWTIKTLEKELKLADSLGIVNLIIHMGKKVKLSQEEAEQNYIKSVKHICKYLQENKLNIKLGLEVTAGEGSSIFVEKEAFVKLYNSFTNKEKKHLSCILDSCHLYGSGIDLNNYTDEYLKYIDDNIGFKNIGCIHLNGSKEKLGSKKDRHSKLIDGYIKYDVLLKIAHFAHESNIPIILETPDSGVEECLKLIVDMTKDS